MFRITKKSLFFSLSFVEMKRKKKKTDFRAARQTSYHTCLSFSWFFGPQRGSFWLTVSWPTGPLSEPLALWRRGGPWWVRANGSYFAVLLLSRHCYKGFWRLNYEITHPPLVILFLSLTALVGESIYLSPSTIYFQRHFTVRCQWIYLYVNPKSKSINC